MDGTPSSILQAILSAGVTILIGLFGFTHLRISQVRAELAEDIKQMRTEHETHLSQMIRTHESLWGELHKIQNDSHDHRERMQKQIGQIPTRDEMKRDLGDLEKRLEGMLLRSIAPR